MVKAMSFGEMLVDLQQKADENARKFKENGGICLACGKGPGYPGGINPYHCKACNDKTAALIKQLQDS